MHAQIVTNSESEWNPKGALHQPECCKHATQRHVHDNPRLSHAGGEGMLATSFPKLHPNPVLLAEVGGKVMGCFSIGEGGTIIKSDAHSAPVPGRTREDTPLIID